MQLVATPVLANAPMSLPRTRDLYDINFPTQAPFILSSSPYITSSRPAWPQTSSSSQPTGNGATVIAFAQPNQVKMVKTDLQKCSRAPLVSSSLHLHSRNAGVEGRKLISRSCLLSSTAAQRKVHKGGQKYFRTNMIPIQFGFLRAAGWNTKLHFSHHWASLFSPKTQAEKGFKQSICLENINGSYLRAIQ